MTAIVLLHSPLTGPTVWHPVANVLTRFGSLVRVPRLDAATHPTWEALADSVVAQLAAKMPNEGALLIAHSAAGAILPLLTDRVRRVQGLVYVDAVLAAGEGSLLAGRTKAERESLIGSASDGIVPRWGHDFAADLWERLVPDPELRARVIDELAPLPLSFFEAAVQPLPVDLAIPGAYLQLSPAYDAPAAEATRRGWPVHRIDGHHLQMLVDPVNVTYALLRLASNF